MKNGISDAEFEMRVEKLIEDQLASGKRFSITPTGIGHDGVIKYDFHCLDCGGYIISAEEPVSRRSKASCKTLFDFAARRISPQSLSSLIDSRVSLVS
jgi:hypothetical protein